MTQPHVSELNSYVPVSTCTKQITKELLLNFQVCCRFDYIFMVIQIGIGLEGVSVLYVILLDGIVVLVYKYFSVFYGSI